MVLYRKKPTAIKIPMTNSCVIKIVISCIEPSPRYDFSDIASPGQECTIGLTHLPGRICYGWLNLLSASNLVQSVQGSAECAWPSTEDLQMDGNRCGRRRLVLKAQS